MFAVFPASTTTKSICDVMVHKSINVVLQCFIFHVENYVAIEKYK